MPKSIPVSIPLIVIEGHVTQSFYPI